MRSCKHEIKQKYRIDISEGNISNWFRQNKRNKCVFVKITFVFSDLKHTEENVDCCIPFKEKIMHSICHNNITFTDEKSHALNDLLKLRVRKDPATSEVPNAVLGSGVSSRKRHSMLCAIRSFKNIHSGKTLICVIAEKNGTEELFQRCVRSITSTVF